MKNDNIHSFLFSLFWLDRLDGNGHLILQNPDPTKNQSEHRHLAKTGLAIWWFSCVRSKPYDVSPVCTTQLNDAFGAR